MKDYYQILQIGPGSTQEEIKRAYRKLAFTYHPDKTNNNRLAEEKFKEIQEAYAVLSDNRKKRAYDASRSIKITANRRPPPPKVSPQWLLNELKRLNVKVSSYDPSRMDQQGLFHTTERLLSSLNMLMLKENDDIKSNRLIIGEVFKIGHRLNYEYTEKLFTRLRMIAFNDRKTLQDIQLYLKRKKQYSYWEKYKLLVAIIVSIILCFVIYFAST